MKLKLIKILLKKNQINLRVFLDKIKKIINNKIHNNLRLNYYGMNLNKTQQIQKVNYYKNMKIIYYNKSIKNQKNN